MRRIALLCCLATLPAAEGVGAEAGTGAPMVLGPVPLTIGMPRDAAVAALRSQGDFLVTDLGESRWAVADKKAMSAVAVLTFDRSDRLRRIEKNWTPVPDTAVAFAEALYQLADQMRAAGGAPDPQPCTLSTSRSSSTSPYARWRDPGRPDMEIRRIELRCRERTVEIHIHAPTDVTRPADYYLHVERVLLYESAAGS